MKIQDLNQLELIHGTFTLIFIIISILLGVRILIKYFSAKQKELITVGLAWIFLSSGWWGSGFSFLSILLFQQTLDQFTYLLIGNVFIPIAIICWIYSFTSLAYPKLKKKLLIIYILISIAFEIYLIISLFIDPNSIGIIIGTFYSQPSLIPMLFILFAVLTTIITGILFSRNSIRSENPEVHKKGLILLIAFISFTVGAFMDAVITLTPVTLIIVRLILISSAIEYYFGFLLPKRLAK
ncbi:MAG: hypothetical protein EU532_13530 [Promethearchaeota archaeon]|nr:MAG: hypothetical protein EU532_13530 [Candidatus Lokiarchaeota archaeon]